jgi:hypothetical protein
MVGMARCQGKRAKVAENGLIFHFSAGSLVSCKGVTDRIAQDGCPRCWCTQCSCAKRMAGHGARGPVESDGGPAESRGRERRRA